MKHNEDPSGESEQCQHSPLPTGSHQVRLCTENKAKCPSDAIEPRSLLYFFLKIISKMLKRRGLKPQLKRLYRSESSNLMKGLIS